jgi:hypothetical protein
MTVGKKRKSWIVRQFDVISFRNHRGAEMNQTTSRVSKIWKVYEGFYGDYTSGRSTTQSIPLLGLQRSSRYPLDTDPPR